MRPTLSEDDVIEKLSAAVDTEFLRELFAMTPAERVARHNSEAGRERRLRGEKRMLAILRSL